MMFSKNTLARALVLGSMTQTAMGHTWLETIRRISPNGLFVGEPGYPRGYHPRDEPGFNDDVIMHRILQVDDKTPLCKDSQQPGAYNDKYPRLTAAPGEHVALQYLENGHTTTPQVPVGRPYKGGIVSVYATTESIQNQAYNDVHGAWNAEGTGGDKKGRLIATRYFDDGLCYENRGDNSIPIYAERKAEAKVDNLLCQTDIVIPEDFKTGETMHLAWVWEWPLNVNQDNQSNETYTTCAEIKVGKAAGNSSVNAKGKNNKGNFDSSPYTDRAIPEQMSSQFMVFGFGTGTAAPAEATAFPTTSPGEGTAFPTTSSKAKTPGIKTVTVTADATTVTDFKTITVGAGNGGQNNEQQTSASSSSSSAPATATASASASASASATTASTLQTSVRASSSAPTSMVPVTSIEKFLKARVTGQARRVA